MQHLDLIAAEALRTAAGAPVRAGGVDLHARSGWCLAYARRVVEAAQGWPDGSLYARHGTHRVERTDGSAPGAWWARDMERSMRAQGHAVPTGDPILPGDLVFNWRAAMSPQGYIGHVGVVTHGELVAENVSPAYRPHSLVRRGSCIVLTPLAAFARTTVVRLPA